MIRLIDRMINCLLQGTEVTGMLSWIFFHSFHFMHSIIRVRFCRNEIWFLKFQLARDLRKIYTLQMQQYRAGLSDATTCCVPGRRQSAPARLPHRVQARRSATAGDFGESTAFKPRWVTHAFGRVPWDGLVAVPGEKRTAGHHFILSRTFPPVFHNDSNNNVAILVKVCSF